MRSPIEALPHHAIRLILLSSGVKLYISPLLSKMKPTIGLRIRGRSEGAGQAAFHRLGRRPVAAINQSLTKLCVPCAHCTLTCTVCSVQDPTPPGSCLLPKAPRSANRAGPSAFGELRWLSTEATLAGCDDARLRTGGRVC